MSSENNKPEAQELELWDRISTTDGAERAEVLDELSHIAYRKNNYTECLQLIETSIDIYFHLCMDVYTSQLAHLYEGKAFCHANLGQNAEAAKAFDLLAGFYYIDEKQEDFLKAKRAAGREWYEAKEYEKSLECHTIVSKEIDTEATKYTMGIDTMNIGLALQKLDFHAEAIESFVKARTLFKEDKNPEYVNWCDSFLAASYIELKVGMEALFHSQNYFNYAKVAEDLTMEGYARYRLGQAHRLNKQYVEAEDHFVKSLEQLTLDDTKDWETIIKVNHELAATLFAQGKDEAAKTRLDRIATIEETMGDS